MLGSAHVPVSQHAHMLCTHVPNHQKKNSISQTEAAAAAICSKTKSHVSLLQHKNFITCSSLKLKHLNFSAPLTSLHGTLNFDWLLLELQPHVSSMLGENAFRFSCLKPLPNSYQAIAFLHYDLIEAFTHNI